MRHRLRTYISLPLLTLFLPGHSVFAQSATIKGRVTDDQDQPLPGVNVVVKGSTTGTLTDAEGLFSLTPVNPLTPKDALVFSFIGFINSDIIIGNQRTINVQLKAANQTLN